MAGFDNDVVYASNVDFRGVTPIAGQVTADGQLLIGATAAPNIRVGSLASSGGTLEINVGAGTLSVENNRWLTPYVVDPSAVVGQKGTYSTIQAAITAASGAGGGNVFIRAGTYTENLTLAASVNLFAFKDGTLAGNAFDLVTVLGSHGAAYNGTCEIENIAFQDNGLDPVFSVSDAVNSPVINFKNCKFTSAPGRCIVAGQNSSVTVIGCYLTANSYGIQGTSTANVVIKDSTLTGSIVAAIDVGGTSTWSVKNSTLSATTEAINISSATASGSSEECTLSSAGDGIKFTAAGSWTSVRDTYSATTTAVSGAAGTLSYADVIFTSNTTIAAGITQTILNWRPYATTTTAGTASFDPIDFTVTNGLVSLVGSGSFTWSAIGASQALVVNNGYICNAGAGLSLSLPAASAVGDLIEVTLDGSTSWTITQGVGQQIRIGANQTTLGGGGSLASTGQGDSIRMVCSVANLRWNVISSIGNITRV